MKCKIIKILLFVVALFCSTSIMGENYHFSSYHFYTSDDNKYLESGLQNDSATIAVNEAAREIECQIYNTEVGKWLPFVLKIEEKIDLGIRAKLGTLYICKNVAGQISSVCVCKSGEDILIDIHNLFKTESPVNCWVRTRSLNH